MNMKKNLIALGAALVIGLTGCGMTSQVNVEQAGMLTTAATSSDKFAGIVVSENEVTVDRDTDKQIEKLYVSVGDTVRLNEKLLICHVLVHRDLLHISYALERKIYGSRIVL